MPRLSPYSAEQKKMIVDAVRHTRKDGTWADALKAVKSDWVTKVDLKSNEAKRVSGSKSHQRSRAPRQATHRSKTGLTNIESIVARMVEND